MKVGTCSRSRRSAQHGAALLTVLLLVAVMMVLVIGVLDDIRFGLRRAANAQTIAQAQWYAIGAEALSRLQIEKLARRDAARTTLAGNWNNRPFVFPIDHGAISGRVFDNTGCFNLNSVVEGVDEQWQRRDLGVAQFIALLEALDFSPPEAQTLSDTLVDWIDSDQQRGDSGAEDADYAMRRLGYGTSGALLSETSELRAIAGFDAKVYARLRSAVCALPTGELSPVNVNTLGQDQAVVLRMLTGGTLSRDSARRVIAARPPGGWRDAASFWGQPGLSGYAAPYPVLNQISLRTRFFGLHAQVEYAGAQVVLSSLFEQDVAGETRLVSRRWTADE